MTELAPLLTNFSAVSAGKFDIRQAGQFDDHGSSGKESPQVFRMKNIPVPRII
jgi:hypothetical protein